MSEVENSRLGVGEGKLNGGTGHVRPSEEKADPATREEDERKNLLLEGALSASRDGGGRHSGKTSNRDSRGSQGGRNHRTSHDHDRNRYSKKDREGNGWRGGRIGDRGKGRRENDSRHNCYGRHHHHSRHHRRSKSRSHSPSPPRDRERFRRERDKEQWVTDSPRRRSRSPSLSPPVDGHTRRDERRRRGRDRHRPPDHPAHGHSTDNYGTRRGDDSTKQQQQQQQQHPSLSPYTIVQQPSDERLGEIQDDPRGSDPTKRITQKASSRGTGRNTESFDPASTLVRPDLRVWVGSNTIRTCNKPLKHDDVVIVPELFGPEQDWTIYYKLVDEITTLQKSGKKESEWISWHEGAHLISKNPSGCQTFEMVIDRLCEYFNIRKASIGTRFNWYRDSSDWKPFHHDSAAFNAQRAKNQNITVGVSFGATRELAFIRAKPYEDGEKCRLYFPQTNNGVFSFGRDANILWKHGINALPPEQQDGKGRISIILWGLAQNVIEEEGSPPLLGSDGQGPHARRNDRIRDGRGRGGGGRDRRHGGRSAGSKSRGRCKGEQVQQSDMLETADKTAESSVPYEG